MLQAAAGCVLTLDGTPWKFPIGAAGPVKPGRHTVGCSDTGETIDVEAPAHFDSTLDYWGP